MPPHIVSLHDIAPEDVPPHITKAAYYRRLLAEALTRGLDPLPIGVAAYLPRTTINLFHPMLGQIDALAKQKDLPVSELLTGLLLAGQPHARKALAQDATEAPAPACYTMKTSRPLQAQFFAGIHTIMRHRYRNIALAEGSTGIGKGRAIIAAAIDAALREAGPVVIVTPTVVLARTLLDEYLSLRDADPACAESGVVPAIMPAWGEFIDEQLLEERIDSFEPDAPGISLRVQRWIAAGGPSDLSGLAAPTSSDNITGGARSGLGRSMVHHGFEPRWLTESLRALAPELPVDEFKLAGAPPQDATVSQGAALCAEYRKVARNAPVIICTHAMLGYAQKNGWRGTSLPRPGTLIIDEAHLFEQSMAGVHSDSLSFSGLAAALRRYDESRQAAPDTSAVEADGEADAATSKPKKRGRKKTKPTPLQASRAIQDLCKAIVRDLFARINTDEDQVSNRAIVEYHLQGSGGCLDPAYHAEILKYLRRIADLFAHIPISSASEDVRDYRQLVRDLTAIMTAALTRSKPPLADGAVIDSAAAESASEAEQSPDADDDADVAPDPGAWQRQAQRVTLRFSPDRRYPSLVFGASDVGGYIGALWKSAIHGGAAVSATLTTRKWDGSGAIDSSYITRLLAIPPGRAQTAQPVVSPSLTDTPTLFTPTRASAVALCVPRQPPAKAKAKVWEDYQAAMTRWTDNIAVRVRMIAKAAAGGTLVLCTSYRTVFDIAARLNAHPDFDMRRLVQAKPGLPFAVLDAQYRALHRAGLKPVLLGVGAAWTGVDFRDETIPDSKAAQDMLLTDMIITRLPINLNRTPTMQQRFDDNGFRAINMETQIMFKQGLGRLIRRENLTRRRIWVLDGRIALPKNLKVHGLAAAIDVILKTYKLRENF